MFSLFLLLSLFFTAYSAQGNLRTYNLISSNDEWKQFSNFQEKFAKKYDNLEELESRFQVFRSLCPVRPSARRAKKGRFRRSRRAA